MNLSYIVFSMFSSLWEKKDFRKICTKILEIYSEAQESLHFFMPLAFIIAFEYASWSSTHPLIMACLPGARHYGNWWYSASKTDELCPSGALSGGGEEGQVASKQTNQSVRLLVTNVCRSPEWPRMGSQSHPSCYPNSSLSL